jgi:hypothetical protein
MPTTARSRKADPATLESLWNEVRGELHRAKRRIDEEIRSYPTPIPRCDAQFNHLQEQRARLARELDRIGAPSGKDMGCGDYVGLIEAYIASATYTDDRAEREFRSRLEAALSAIEG